MRISGGGLNRNEFTVRFPQDGYETDESDIALDAALNSDTQIERVVVKVNDETIKNPVNPEYNPSYTKAKIDWKLPLHLGQNEIDLIAFTESGIVGKKLTVVRTADKQNYETSPSKWAVVIGIENYDDKKMINLKYAGNDAEAFARVLIEKGSFPADHVILLTDKPLDGTLNKVTKEAPTYYNIKRALFTMLRAKTNKKDSIIIFYSGHGVLVPDETTPFGKAAYLAPKDFEYDYPEVKGLRIEDVKRLAYLSPERIFLIIDCCFSGGGAIGVKSVDFGMMIKGGPDDITGGFAGKGRVLFASSLDNQVSIESDELKHGVFTHFLLDATNKGEKRLSEIYRYMHTNVLKFTRGNQEPKLDTVDQRGDILIY